MTGLSIQAQEAPGGGKRLRAALVVRPVLGVDPPQRGIYRLIFQEVAARGQIRQFQFSKFFFFFKAIVVESKAQTERTRRIESDSQRQRDCGSWDLSSPRTGVACWGNAWGGCGGRRGARPVLSLRFRRTDVFLQK